MARRDDTDGLEPVVIGPDGFAMLALSVALMLLSLGVTLLLASGHVLWAALRTPHVAAPGGHIIVLGMRLDEAGEPTRRYRARLDRARALWLRAQGCRIVILGGSTSPGARPEADAGAAYLRARGVPADRLDTEDRSRHTLENLLHYRERFPVRAGGATIAGNQPVSSGPQFAAGCRPWHRAHASAPPKTAGCRRSGTCRACWSRRC